MDYGLVSGSLVQAQYWERVRYSLSSAILHIFLLCGLVVEKKVNQY